MTRPPTTADRPAARPLRPRAGFTLVELLVVIAIIATLLGLTAGAAAAFLTDAREAATRATLAKIDGKLQRRMAALRRSGDRGSGDGSRVGRGVVSPLSLKTEQARRMPAYLVSFRPQAGQDGELGTPDDVIPPPLFEEQDLTFRVRNGLDAAGPFAGNTVDNPDGPDFVPLHADYDAYAADATASSEALYRFLTVGESYGVRDTDEAAFTESELADTDGDGLREIVDGWGNPIRFYRWPTRLIRPALDADGDGVIDSAEVAAASNGRHPVASVTAPASEVAEAAAVLLADRLPPREFDPDGSPVTDDADAFGSDPDPFLPRLGSLLRADPDDPQAQVGLNFLAAYYPTVNPADPAAVAALGDEFEFLFHTPTTWHTPLVVSAGADEELGLYEPQDRASFGHAGQLSDPTAALDNLTNLQGGF